MIFELFIYQVQMTLFFKHSHFLQNGVNQMLLIQSGYTLRIYFSQKLKTSADKMVSWMEKQFLLEIKPFKQFIYYVTKKQILGKKH